MRTQLQRHGLLFTVAPRRHVGGAEPPKAGITPRHAHQPPQGRHLSQRLVDHELAQCGSTLFRPVKSDAQARAAFPEPPAGRQQVPLGSTRQHRWVRGSHGWMSRCASTAAITCTASPFRLPLQRSLCRCRCRSLPPAPVDDNDAPELVDDHTPNPWRAAPNSWRAAPNSWLAINQRVG